MKEAENMKQAGIMEQTKKEAEGGEKKVAHPAKFTPGILSVIDGMLADLDAWSWVLDPFAGVGGIHGLNHRLRTFAVELEPEWAEQSAERGPTYCGDFFAFDWETDGPGGSGKLRAIATSPTYGNRMADKHQPGVGDKSTRLTYTHKLGRKLTTNNSGGLQWGVDYQVFHIRAWRKVHAMLPEGGLFALNVKNHIRGGVEVDVVGWHREFLIGLGFELRGEVEVPVKGMGFGQHQHTHKVDHEVVMLFRKGADR